MALRRTFLHFLAVPGLSSVLTAQAQPSRSPALADGGKETVLGRYSTSSAAPPPELAEPLEIVATVTFPRATVRTVGEAVRHMLARTGYRLHGNAMTTPPGVNEFLDLPLPESQRQIGPYRVRSILDVLLGSAWQWHSDPLKRVVWFSPSSPDSSHAAAPELPVQGLSEPATATPIPVREVAPLGS